MSVHAFIPLVEACLPDPFLALQDQVTLDFNNPVAVLCFSSDNADGLGKVQVHKEAVIHFCHCIQSSPVACTCSTVPLFDDHHFNAASIEPTCTAV